MVWIIVYVFLALLTFIALTVIITNIVNEQNAIFNIPIYTVPVGRLILLSLVFPFVWVAIIIQIIMNR